MHRFVFFVAALGLGFCFPGCESTSSTTTRKAAPVQVVMPENEVSAIAQREIVRRKERIAAADRAALQAAQRDAAGDTAGAIEGYSRALDTLPATR